MKKLFFLLSAFVVMAACNRNDDNGVLPQIGTHYFPLKLGATWVYKVDSIAYDDNGPTQAIDTFYYQYKEEITEVQTDDMGQPLYVIGRFFRQHDSDTWLQVRNYTAQIIDNKAQRVEENTRYVKLVFPLRNRNTWNGNMFNAKGSQIYKLLDFESPYTYQSTNYKIIKVEQANTLNFIEEIKRYERFAENIGMVELLYDSLNTQTTGTKGFRYRLNLTNFTQ
jgi:hypothetical protein